MTYGRFRDRRKTSRFTKKDAISVLREQDSRRQGCKEGINEESMPVAGNTRIPAGYKIVAADWHPITMHASPFDQSQYQHVKH